MMKTNFTLKMTLIFIFTLKTCGKWLVCTFPFYDAFYLVSLLNKF